MRYPKAFKNCCFCHKELTSTMWCHTSCRREVRIIDLLEIPDHISEKQHEKFILERVKKLK